MIVDILRFQDKEKAPDLSGAKSSIGTKAGIEKIIQLLKTFIFFIFQSSTLPRNIPLLIFS
jgi:hypothetical protein